MPSLIYILKRGLEIGKSLLQSGAKDGLLQLEGAMTKENPFGKNEGPAAVSSKAADKANPSPGVKQT